MRLRAGIIGTGRIASSLERDPYRSKPHTHAGWYVSRPHILLTAGSDTNPHSLEAFGAAWHIGPEHLYADYLAMLAAERLDLVSIAAYAPERVTMAEAAIAAGARGLWLEKAIGCSVVEAERLLARCRHGRVSVVVNHPRSQDGAYRAVRRHIAEATFGTLEAVHAIFSGHLLHTGTHAWEVLDAWCGPWREVRCWPDARLGEDGLSDVGGRVHIVFESGTQAFVSGLAKDYFVFQFDAIFSRGRIRLGNEVSEQYGVGPSRRYEGFIELADAGAPIEGRGGPPLVDELAGSVLAGEPRLTSLEAAARALTLGIATVQAGRAPGEPVTPQTLDRTLYVPSR
jgi:predicted dehydrogenase